MTSVARNPLPLEGIRVLDLSRHLPGPWCSQFLGDLGADVVKVEQRGVGDPSRHNPPRYREDTVYFHSVNGGKRSLSLDLGHSQAAEIKRRLLARADVVVENFNTGGADRLGVGYEDARRANPGVIYCSISGFGRTGPFNQAAGHDLAIQSLTGMLGARTAGEASPPNPPFHAANYSGAAVSVIGILAALQRRHTTGEGCYLDLAMYDSLMSMLDLALVSAMGRRAGTPDTRTMDVWGSNPRYRTYPTRDGKAVAVCLLEAKLWRTFCEAQGRPDLVHGEESLEDRLTAHADRAAAYGRLITEYCRTRSRDEIVAEAKRLRLPITPVLTPDEGLVSDVAVARGAILGPREDDVEGRVVQLRNPLRHSGLVRERRGGPRLGADTEAVLEELGFTQAECDAFRAAAVL